jgi:hypothetical protein
LVAQLLAYTSTRLIRMATAWAWSTPGSPCGHCPPGRSLRCAAPAGRGPDPPPKSACEGRASLRLWHRQCRSRQPGGQKGAAGITGILHQRLILPLKSSGGGEWNRPSVFVACFARRGRRHKPIVCPSGNFSQLARRYFRVTCHSRTLVLSGRISSTMKMCELRR